MRATICPNAIILTKGRRAAISVVAKGSFEGKTLILSCA